MAKPESGPHWPTCTMHACASGKVLHMSMKLGVGGCIAASSHKQEADVPCVPQHVVHMCVSHVCLPN